MLTSSSISLESQLWERYRDKSDRDSREKIIARYEGEVRKIASYLYKKRIDDVASYEDYYHFGLVGMLESIDRYNCRSEANFSTYSGYRIKGAILIGVSKMSEKRSRQKILQKSTMRRNQSLLSGIEHADYEQLIDYVVDYALSHLLEYSADCLNLQGSERETVADINLLNEKISYYTENLPLKVKLVIQYHYYKELTFSEISVILGVSVSRVSQLHKEGIQALNAKVNGLKKERHQFSPL